MANCQPGGWLSSAGAYVNGIFLSFQNSRLVPLRMGAEPDHRESPEAAAPGSTARRCCAGRGGPEGSRVLADPAGYRSLACLCGPAEAKKEAPGGGNLDASEENQWTRVGGTRQDAHRLLCNSLPHMLRKATVSARARVRKTGLPNGERRRGQPTGGLRRARDWIAED